MFTLKTVRLTEKRPLLYLYYFARQIMIPIVGWQNVALWCPRTWLAGKSSVWFASLACNSFGPPPSHSFGPPPIWGGDRAVRYLGWGGSHLGISQIRHSRAGVGNQLLSWNIEGKIQSRDTTL